ncbi:uncharacterized protein B0H18DRAFT_1105556 [Fomitopsis serialis]|uniref:uncharacterized protein n=1 Tax=Fomitopsis serialis TaxID=139415 RepID=UPI00200746AE|nr:uncharacterized protein B0H18DRAFT_1105556 [Neoantrodia serialis]KAH9922648.1 hypothetical protein B0H18DRAFT_1105556 [Neoantrodia serialis]
MDVRKVFPSSLRRSKSKRDQSASVAAAAPSPPQNVATPEAYTPTMPITIPRRKAILTRKDEWSQHTQFLQQRGRTSILLAQQCHQQQKALCGPTRRNSSAQRNAEALYCSQPLRHGLLAQALRTHERAYSQGPGGDLVDEASEDLTSHNREIVESSALASARSTTHLLRTAAEPVVCLKVAEAEWPDRSRGRSPYPDTGRMFRARRTSSAGSRPTVMTLGRTRSSLVLSNEELERSLEKEDYREERGRGPEHGREELDEKEMVRGWELEYERGRTRGRTRGRGIAVVRAPPAHM